MPDTVVGPLSVDQERLWFIEQLTPGTAAYHISWAVVADGDLDCAVFAASLKTVIKRHAVLRTTFTPGTPLINRVRIRAHSKTRPTGESFGPVQIVHGELSPEIVFEDYTDRLAVNAFEAARRRLAQLVSIPFDLERGPLVRVAVIRIAPRRHAILLCMHHLITDWVSFALFRRELSDCYLHALDPRTPAVSHATGDYLGFVALQRHLLEQDRAATHRDFWVQRLTGHAPTLALPMDRPRPSFRSLSGARTLFGIPRPLSERLQSMAGARGCTPFMAYVAVVGSLLHRYTGDRDIVIGTPVATRWRPELRRMLGYLLNVLAIRLEFAGDVSFDDVLAHARRTVLDALEHAEMPFGHVVEALDFDRDTSRNPVFQVCLLYLDAEPDAGWFAGLRTDALEIDVAASRFDLTFALKNTGDGVGGYLEYPTDIWDQSSIDDVLAQFLTLLARVVGDPVAPISRLALSSPQSLDPIARGWSAGRVLPTVPSSVDELFVRAAAASPSATALIAPRLDGDGSAGQRLSYEMLNERADEVARRLKHAGVGPGSRVAICLARSPALIATILGIWKAGAAYVPLDPATPPARRTAILAAGGAHVLIADGDAESPDATDRAAQVEILRTVRSEDETSDSIPRRGDRLAYVMFTSGSTGEPKGVEVTHAAVVNAIRGVAAEVGLASGVSWLSVTSPAFDISVLEFFLPLAVGGQVCLAPSQLVTSGLAFGRLVSAVGANVVQATPSQWRMLVASGWNGNSGIRILSGGETLSGSLARDLADRADELWNMYGPTEATIWATAARHRLEPPADSDVEVAPPIGRPLPNVQVYALDRWLQPTPAGVVGEIYIGGAGVARGYHDAPRLTAERFVPDPFACEAGARLYRTGDFGAFTRAGALQFAGRRDEQVKIRGHRVELAEIESALKGMPSLAAAAVALRRATPSRADAAANEQTDAAGDCLVLFGVGARDRSPTIQDVRDYVRDRLPAHMVPSRLVILDQLPLTVSGKIDRRRLDEIAIPSHDEPAAFVAPATATERALARIWREVLGIDQVGTTDNFFSLGGDSIQAVIVLARAREQGYEIAVTQLFRTPTIAELALQLDRRAVEGGDALSCGLFELPPSIGPLAEAAGDEFHRLRTAAVLPLPPGLSLDECRTGISRLSKAHDALRGEIVRDDARWCVRLHDLYACHSALSIASTAVDGAIGTAISSAVRGFGDEPPRPGPSLRARLLRSSGDAAGQLLISLHPALIDGASWGILAADLDQIWRGVRNGTTAPLVRPAGAFAPLADGARVVVNSRQAARPPGPDDIVTPREMPLDAKLCDALFRAAASACKASPLELLVTAVAMAASEAAGGDLVIESDDPARTGGLVGLDLSRTVGHLTPSRVVRIACGSDMAPMALLRGVKAALRAPCIDDIPVDRLAIRILAPYEFVPPGPIGPVERVRLVGGCGGLCLCGLGSASVRLLAIPAPGRRPLEPILDRIGSACERLIDASAIDADAALLPSDFPLAAISAEQLGRIAAAVRRQRGSA